MGRKVKTGMTGFRAKGLEFRVTSALQPVIEAPHVEPLKKDCSLQRVPLQVLC